MQGSLNTETVKIISDTIIASLSIIISFAAFLIALLTYKREKRPVVSFMLTVQDDWVVLNIKNTGKGEATQLNIKYSFCGKSNSVSVSYLPPDVHYCLKLEPFSIFKDLPILKRVITFDYHYLDCYRKKKRYNNISISII